MSASADLPTKDAATRLRFVWGLPVVPKPWRFGLVAFYRLAKSRKTGEYYVTENDQGRRYPLSLVISVRGLLCWALALALTAYFGGTGYLYARYRKIPENLVTYADLVQPWRWSGVPELRGRAQLNQAKKQFRAGEFRPALYGLRTGLIRAPHDGEARLQLATLYIAWFRRDLADNVLLDGVAAGDPSLEFINDAIAFLKDSDRPDQLLDFTVKARRLVDASSSEKSARLRMLASAGAEALVALGRTAEAVALAEALNPVDPALNGRIRIVAAFESGQPAAAVQAAEEWVGASPESEVALAAAVGVYRKTGRFAEMDAMLQRLRRLNPTNPGYALLGVVQNLLADREEAARAALEDLVFRFGSYGQTLNTMAREIGGTGRIGLLGRLEEVMREQGFDTQDILVSRLMAQLDQKDWDGALQTQQTLDTRERKLSPAVDVFQKTAGAAGEVCARGTPAARIVLLDQLSRQRGRLKLFTEILGWLVDAGQWPAAGDVLTLADGSYPRSFELAKFRARIDPELARIAATASEQADRTKAARIADSTEAFADADDFLSVVERDRARGALNDALGLIRSARLHGPEWWAAAADKIDRRELELVLEVGDILQVQAVTRDFLRLEKSTRYELTCALARVEHGAGRTAVAELLVREVLRRQPDHTAAKTLLKAWSPKVVAKEAL